METKEKKIGWRVVIAVAGFVTIWSTTGLVTMSQSLSLIINGTGALGIGVLFLLAYYHENESIVFRGVIWVCKQSLFYRGRKNAFFAFAFFTILGMFLILVGLGVINMPKRG